MHKYEDGQPYTSRRSWPELAQYNYRAGEHELVLFLSRPSAFEIDSVRRGKAEFALLVERSLIVLLYRFGRALDWSDAPYSYHLVPPEERTLPPETGPDEWVLLHIVLVDASNGIIRALRVVSLPPAFTQALHRAIREQASLPFTRAAYNSELESLFAGYSSSDLAEMAGVRFASSPALARR